jgi:prepilin-type processing-associated H-X9-DG protein
VTRPADTLLLGEVTGIGPDMHAGFTWFHCNDLFTHLKYPGPGGNANFVFFDGHVKTLKWGQTLFPINENKWQLTPNPDPNNRSIKGALGCEWKVPLEWVCSGSKTDFVRPDQLQ